MNEKLRAYAISWQAIALTRARFHTACNDVDDATAATARTVAGRYADARSDLVTTMAELVVATVRLNHALPAIVDDGDAAMARDAVGTRGEAPLTQILRAGTFRDAAAAQLAAATKGLLEKAQSDLARIPLDRVVALSAAPRPRRRFAPAAAAVAAALMLGLGGAVGAGVPAQAAPTPTTCAEGETARMAVSEAATVTADRSGIPSWTTRVPGGDVVCQVGVLDPMYQDVVVRTADGREGVALPQSFAIMPGGSLPATFSYTDRALLATGELFTYPSTGADTLDAEGGAVVHVDRSFPIEGADGWWTASFVPARTEAGVQGWAVGSELERAPEPSPAATPAETLTTPPAAAEPAGAPFNLGAWLAGVPAPVWVVAAVAAGVVGVGALFVRRKRDGEPGDAVDLPTDDDEDPR